MLTGVRFCRHLHVVGGQQAGDPAHLALPPVRVGLVQDADQLTLGEAQLVLVGGGVVVHGDDLADCGGESRRGQGQFSSFSPGWSGRVDH